MTRPMVRYLLALALLGAVRASAASAEPVAGAAPNACAPTADCPIEYYSGGVAGVGANYWTGQTFTTSFAGKLMHIQLALSSPNDGVGDVACQLRTVSGGLPTGVVIAEVPVPGSPYQQTPYLADFSALNVVLSAATTYALVLHATGSSSVSVHGQFEPCGGGSQLFVGSDSAGLYWTSRSDRTLYYSVCLDFATPTRAPTWGSLKSRYR